MDFRAINWLAVLAAVVAAMIIGSIWFGPKTFFPVWWKAIGKSGTPGTSSGSQTSMVVTWGLVVVAAVVQAIFMALMVNAMGSMTEGGPTLASGATAGFLLWLGFVAPSSLTNKLFADQLPAWVLEMGNHLIVFVLQGAILGAWR